MRSSHAFKGKQNQYSTESMTCTSTKPRSVIQCSKGNFSFFQWNSWWDIWIHPHWDHQNLLLNYPPTFPNSSGYFPTYPFRASCWPSKPTDPFPFDLTTFLSLLDDPPTSSYPRREVQNQGFGSFQRWRRLFEKLLGRNCGTIKIIFRSSTGVDPPTYFCKVEQMRWATRTTRNWRNVAVLMSAGRTSLGISLDQP